MAKVEDWNWGTLFTNIIVYIQPLSRIWPAKQSNSVKNAKSAITPFKVMCHLGRYQSKDRMRSPISD